MGADRAGGATPGADSLRPGVTVPLDLEFDDRPLEALLKSEERSQGTPASLFGEARQQLQRIQWAVADEDWEQAAGLFAQMLEAGRPASLDVLRELRATLDVLRGAAETAPDAPWAAALGPSLESLWQRVEAVGGLDEACATAYTVAAWHESRRDFPRAREALDGLLDLLRSRGDSPRERACLARRIVSYLREKDGQSAAREVWSFAKTEGGLGDPAERAPALVGYLAARYDQTAADAWTPVQEELSDPFRSAQALLTEMTRAQEAQEWSRLPELAVRLMDEGHPISSRQLTALRNALLPFAPNPSQTARLEQTALVGRALESAWSLAKAGGTEEDVNQTGYRLGRWYHLHARLAEFRATLAERLAVFREGGPRREHAVILNDLGVSYWDEREWDRAAEAFQQAVEILEQLGEPLERANSRVNYLGCRLEQGGFEQAADRKPELQELLATFRGKNDWRQCKALYYLARIEEAEGDLQAAATLLRESLALDETLRVTFRDRDQQALARIEAQLGDH